MKFSNSRRWRLYLIRKSNEARKLFSATDWAAWKRVPVRHRGHEASAHAAYLMACASRWPDGTTVDAVSAQVAEYFPEVAAC